LREEETMRTQLLRTAIVLFGCLTGGRVFAQQPGLQKIMPPPRGQLYHGVFPGGPHGTEDDVTRDLVHAYGSLAGKPVAWVYFSQNWFRGFDFPMDTARWIHDSFGSVPYIRLMPRSLDEFGNGPTNHPFFSLRSINAGRYDSLIRRWADSAKDFGSPVIVEFGTEVNYRGFPWNAEWNGHRSGPGAFRDAFRRMVRLSREEGALNLLWVFHVTADDDPDESWNHFEKYYPGDEFVDWIGVSIYAAQGPTDSDWTEFAPQMDEFYRRATRVSAQRSIVVVEFGAPAGNPHGSQAQWAETALSEMLSGRRWPRLIGFSWWNSAWDHTTMRLQDSPDLSAIFQRLVGADPRALGRPVIQ
jgi:Glycosyl hydrolase family 26